MKTTILASSLAVAFGLFACAAPPAEQEERPSAEEPTSETSSELRIGGGIGATCALTCTGGNQTCCCDVGQKCESGATYCQCKPATDPRFTTGTIGFVATP